MNIILMIMPFIMLILLVAVWIDWRKLFEKIWGDNPYKARVYVIAGDKEYPCKGNYAGSTARTILYRYKFNKIWHRVIVKDTYPFIYIQGFRKVRVMIGQSYAAPLEGYHEPECKVGGATLNDVMEAHIGSDLAKTIFGKAINFMTIIIVLAVLFFGGYFMYKNVLSPNVTPTQPNQPAQQQQPAKQPIEVIE